MKKVPFSVFDVFTSIRFHGNPLAVIRNAVGLTVFALAGFVSQG